MKSVSDFGGTQKRASEASVERKLAAALTKLGIYSRHMSDAVPGLPDRYVRGGNWIEVKSLWRKRGGFAFGEGLSPEQKRVGRELVSAGDRVFYFAQLDGWELGKVFVLMPFQTIATKQSGEIMDQWCREYFSLQSELISIFL